MMDRGQQPRLRSFPQLNGEDVMIGRLALGAVVACLWAPSAAVAQFGNYFQQQAGGSGLTFVDSGTPVRPNDTWIQVVTNGSIGSCTSPCSGQMPLSAFGAFSSASSLALQQLQTSVGQLQQGFSQLQLSAFQLQQAAAQMQQSVTQSYRGTAAVAAIGSISMPSAPGRTTWAINGAAFQNEIGGGISFAHRLNMNIPVAISASYGNGGGSAHVGRVGLMGEF
jgi:hypothetical protein